MTGNDDKKSFSRRSFLKNAAIGGATLAVANAVGLPDVAAAAPAAKGKTMAGVPFAATEKVRIGLIGVGGRGSSLLRDLLAIEGVQLQAICDIVPEKVARAQATVVKAGQAEPTGYSKGDHDFENLAKRDDLDLIYIATPWDWHVPMAVFGMKNGKHVAVEVPVAPTLKGCWEIIDTSEATRKHCVILENCCYGFNEMMVLNMVRAGFFGELTHGEAAYIHDLRSLLVADEGEGLWRRFPHMKRNANLYPTHGLGPVSLYMDINRGDRFEYIVSVSSREAGLSNYVKSHLAEGDPKRKEKYVCGDVNTSVIKTANGRTIMLQHDVISPRPYSRLNMISGTKATFADYPARIFVDGQKGHDWQKIEPFREQFQHELWKSTGELARKMGGHGGMDYIMSYRLIECMRKGLAPDLDVYDAAAWSAPTGLSELSVAANGSSQKFPDFTRGHWSGRKA